MGTWSLAWRIARRELRGGLRGFWIFLACLMLGVAAIAAVQSVSRGVVEGLRDDGRAILGGDIEYRTRFRPPGEEELAYLDDLGSVARAVEMRAMARSVDTQDSTLVELKAVDPDLYPLYGTFDIMDGGTLADAIGVSDGQWGVVIDETLGPRLGLETGSLVRIGQTEYIVRGIIEFEPDRASSGSFTLGPRVVIDDSSLEETGLIQPGSLIEWRYKLRLDDGRTVQSVRAEVAEQFPEAGWGVRDHTNAAPQIQRFVGRLALFLTLVGLTSLLVGGVGVGNAVSTFLSGKIRTIATLKCLGAEERLVTRAYLLQISALAGLGIALGIFIGSIIPAYLDSAISQFLPFTVNIGIYPDGLAIAAGFGLLTALAFSLWPLGRAGRTRAGALFRDAITPDHSRPKGSYMVGMALAGGGLAALAIATAVDQIFAAAFVAGSVAALVLFRLAATLVMRTTAALGRPSLPVLRLALTNIHRPGAPTPAVVLSLGLGLTVLVAVALIEGNFDKQVGETMPDDAPAFFFVDIQPDQLEPFLDTVENADGVSGVNYTASLRGRIAKVGGRDPQDALIDRDNEWLLRGDRGVTYRTVPYEPNDVVAGTWWPADYQGPPQIAIYEEIAQSFGLGIGDTITINILGRDITAEIAAVRTIDFTTLQINFTLVFSPGVLENAPQTFIATVRADPGSEGALQRAVGEQFPNVTAVNVRDALNTVRDVLGDIGLAVRLTAAVALVTGTLVLAGAIAAGHRRRIYDAVVLKVLGATRRDVAGAFLLEYGLMGLITAAIAAILGTITAWSVVTLVMEFEWTFIPESIVATTLICTAITLGLGFVGTWRAMGQKAAPLLRNE